MWVVAFVEANLMETSDLLSTMNEYELVIVDELSRSYNKTLENKYKSYKYFFQVKRERLQSL